MEAEQMNQPGANAPVPPTPPPQPMNNPPSAGGPAPGPEHHSSLGATLGVLIILAVIILGGLYFWKERGTTREELENIETSQELEAIGTQGSSDDPSSIDADLNNTNIDDLDAELNAS